MKKHYELPITGEITTNVSKYCNAYHNLAKPFERIGYILSSFDKGIRLRTKDFKQSIDLTSQQALIIGKELNKAKSKNYKVRENWNVLQTFSKAKHL